MGRRGKILLRWATGAFTVLILLFSYLKFRDNQSPAENESVRYGDVIQAAQEHRLRQEYFEAESLLSGLLDGDPKNPTILRELGITYLEQGRAESAVETFYELLEVEPNSGVNHSWAALALEENDDRATALIHFEKAAKLLPEGRDKARALAKLQNLSAQNQKPR